MTFVCLMFKVCQHFDMKIYMMSQALSGADNKHDPENLLIGTVLLATVLDHNIT